MSKELRETILRTIIDLQKSAIDFESLSKLLPEIQSEDLQKALNALSSDGLLKILYADDIPYLMTLMPKGENYFEE